MSYKFGISALIFVILMCGTLCQDIKNESSTSENNSENVSKIFTDKSTSTPSEITDTTIPSTKTEPTTVPQTTMETTSEVPVTTQPPSPAPSGFNYFNVSSGGTICTMFLGDFVFMVTYSVGADKLNETKVYAPKLADSNVHVSGSCDSKNQWIKVVWGESFKESSIRLNFTSENNVWQMAGIQSTLYMDNETFPNATKSGNVLKSTFNVSVNSIGAPVNESYKCFAEVFLNGSTVMNEQVYMYPLQLSIKDFQIQAYNNIKGRNEFVDALHCDADRIADIVPIAVGCALAGLVLIVVIAYFIGRRRRTQAYQSV